MQTLDDAMGTETEVSQVYVGVDVRREVRCWRLFGRSRCERWLKTFLVPEVQVTYLQYLPIPHAVLGPLPCTSTIGTVRQRHDTMAERRR